MLSVVVVSSKSEKQLYRCVRSISDSLDLISADSEIIVLFNHGEKVSFLEVEAFAEGKNIKFFESATKTPLSCLKNKGVSAAQGDIIAFTDDDCTVDINWAKAVQGTLGAGASWVFGPVVSGDKLPFWAKGDAGWLMGLNIGGAFPVGSNMAFNKNIVLQNKFNENIGPGTKYPLGEDYELSLRLKLLKTDGILSKEMLVSHYVDADKKTFFAAYKRCINEAKMLYFIFGKKIAAKRFSLLFLWPFLLILKRDFNPLFRSIVSVHYFLLWMRRGI